MAFLTWVPDVLRAADDMHAAICEMIERLFDAKPGSPREAQLKFLVAVAEAYDAARWPIETGC